VQKARDEQAFCRPPRLGSEEQRRQNAHRPSVAPHADRRADALHRPDGLRRLEARHGSCGALKHAIGRHGSCCRTVLRVLLLVPDFVDPKRVVEGRDDVAIPLVLAGKTLHQGESFARELADLPPGRDVPKAHRVVHAAADDLCAVVVERYLVHSARVPRQRTHL